MKKKIIVFLSFIAFFSFTAGEKTATLKVSEQDYKAIQFKLQDIYKRIDSAKIAISYLEGGAKIQTSLSGAQQQLDEVYRYFGQIDSVFNKQ